MCKCRPKTRVVAVYYLFTTQKFWARFDTKLQSHDKISWIAEHRSQALIACHWHHLLIAEIHQPTAFKRVRDTQRPTLSFSAASYLHSSFQMSIVHPNTHTVWGQDSIPQYLTWVVPQTLGNIYVSGLGTQHLSNKGASFTWPTLLDKTVWTTSNSHTCSLSGSDEWSWCKHTTAEPHSSVFSSYQKVCSDDHHAGATRMHGRLQLASVAEIVRDKCKRWTMWLCQWCLRGVMLSSRDSWAGMDCSEGRGRLLLDWLSHLQVTIVNLSAHKLAKCH